MSESPENTIGEIKNKYLYTIKDMSYLLLFNSFICLLKECLVTVKKSAPASSRKASQVSLEVKNPPANARDIRDVGSVPGVGRSSGERNGNPLQCSCLENPMDRRAWWARVHGVAKESDRIENQVTERHLAPPHRRERSPGASPGGAVHLLRTGSPSTHPHGPLSWPCTRAQRTELNVTAGASSQGTDSEPRPPGLVLGVKLHPGPSTQNWRVKGSGGHQSPPSSQKQRRGGAPRAHPVHPSSSPQPAPAPPHLFAQSLSSRFPHS